MLDLLGLVLESPQQVVHGGNLRLLTVDLTDGLRQSLDQVRNLVLVPLVPVLALTESQQTYMRWLETSSYNSSIFCS
jgi:hypothetical protein